MGQPKLRATAGPLVAVMAWVALMGLIGCNRHTASIPSPTTAPGPTPKVASLVPVATDVILGMGAGDHLVAVSNYDPATVDGRQLPHVGDYQSTDWETLATLRPQVMIIQFDEQRLAMGFKEKAAQLGITLVNIRPAGLADAIEMTRKIGAAVGEPAKAEALARKIDGQLAAVRQQAQGRPAVRTLLTLDVEGTSLAGPGSFLDDLLKAAGGEDVAASLGSAYPSADRETLARLKPDVVIVLKPRATADTLPRAKEFWAALPGAPAGKSGRVYVIAEPYVLLAGSHLGDIAQAMQRCLLDSANTGATPP